MGESLIARGAQGVGVIALGLYSIDPIKNFIADIKNLKKKHKSSNTADNILNAYSTISDLVIMYQIWSTFNKLYH